jgi:hypothetical protein
MNDKLTSRRRFLTAALALSGVATTTLGTSLLRTSAAWAASGDSPGARLELGRMAQLLFPHEGLDDDVYGWIIGDILEAAANDEAVATMLAAAEASLNSAQDTNWLDLDEKSQLAVMREIEAESYVVGIRESVRFRLYYHPELWKHINYPGSSKEHGGYLHRGFNDIAWLPEEN